MPSIGAVPCRMPSQELSCQETGWQLQPCLGRSTAWRGLLWKMVLADKVAVGTGAAWPREAPGGHRRATCPWAGAASTGGGALRELGSRPGAGSASEGGRGPCQPLTAESHRCGSCAFPAIPKSVWRQGLGWALLPGPPSRTRRPITHRGASWLGVRPSGLEGWGADRKEQSFQNTIFFKILTKLAITED